MKGKVLLSLFATTISLVTLLQGGTIPGRWEKVEALAVQQPIVVSLKSGERIEGLFRGVTSEHILLAMAAENELKIARSNVQRISRREEDGDSNLNGTLLGLAAGLALGGVAVGTESHASFVSTPGQQPAAVGRVHVESGGTRSNPALIVAGAGALGAIIGLLIDSSEKDAESRYQIIYESP